MELQQRKTEQTGQNTVSITTPDITDVQPISGSDIVNRMATQSLFRSPTGLGIETTPVGNQLFLEQKSICPLYNQTADVVEAKFEPTIARIFEYQKDPKILNKVLVGYDTSTTADRKQADIERKKNEINRWISTSIGGQVEETENIDGPANADHRIAPMPDDMDELNRWNVLAHEQAFVDYFGNCIFTDQNGQTARIKGGEKTVQEFVDYLYKNPNKLPDHDNHRGMINSFVKSFEEGTASYTDLVLVGDGGNAYSYWKFNETAYNEWKKNPWNYKGPEPWKFEFESTRYEADLAAVEKFSSSHPDARIHFAHDQFSPGGMEIFTPPTDHAQIAELARATGGQVITYTGDFNLDLKRQVFSPISYALIPVQENVELSVRPVRRPIFSSEFGSRDYVNLYDPFKYNFKSGSASGTEVDLKGLISDPDTYSPNPLLELGFRTRETGPWLERAIQLFGMKELFGMDDEDMRGKAWPMSYLLDWWVGTRTVDEYAKDAITKWNSPSPVVENSEGLSNYVLQYYENNKEKILKSAWDGIQEGEFESLGKRSIALRDLSDNLLKITYFENWMNYTAGTLEYERMKELRNNEGKKTIAYAANVFAPDKMSTMCYYAALLKLMHSVTHAEDSGRAYFKFFYEGGKTDVAPSDNMTRSLGYTPALRLGVVVLRDPHLEILENQGLLLQMQGFTGVFFNGIYNAKMFDFLQSENHSLDFKLDVGFGPLIADSKDHSIKLGVVDIKGDSYVGRWNLDGSTFRNLDGSTFMGSLQASINGQWKPFKNELVLDYSATLLGPSTGILTYLAYGKSSQDIYKIAPQLNQTLWPVELSLNPKWNILVGPVNTMMEIGIKAIGTEEGVVINNLHMGAKCNYKGHELSVNYSRQGLVGLGTEAFFAKYETELFDKFQLEIDTGLSRADRLDQKVRPTGFEHDPNIKTPDYLDPGNKSALYFNVRMVYTIPDVFR